MEQGKAAMTLGENSQAYQLVAHIVYMIKPGNTITIGALRPCHWAKRLSGRIVVSMTVGVKTTGDTSSWVNFTFIIIMRTCFSPTCFVRPGRTGMLVPVGGAAWV